MMILRFEVDYTQEYTILRDYYVYNKNFQGVVFVLKHKDSGEVLSKFLSQEEMNNMFVWKKAKKEKEVKQVANGIEEGEEPKLFIETGHVMVKRWYSKQEKKVPARKFRYVLD